MLTGAVCSGQVSIGRECDKVALVFLQIWKILSAVIRSNCSDFLHVNSGPYVRSLAFQKFG